MDMITIESVLVTEILTNNCEATEKCIELLEVVSTYECLATCVRKSIAKLVKELSQPKEVVKVEEVVKLEEVNVNEETIKDAWKTFKKEIKKELGLTYFSMNAKQLENRQATYGMGCRKYDDVEKNAECKEVMKNIEDSKAFKNFSRVVNGCALEIEKTPYRDGYYDYRIRFHY